MGMLLRRRWRMPVLLGIALGLLLLQAVNASAVVRPGPPPSRLTVRSNTEMTVTGWSPGQGVSGFIATAANAFDPVGDGYPTSDPPVGTDWSTKDEGYAGLIQGEPPGGGATLNLYCIDINTDTWVGVGYALGTWDESNVQNVGYVARILNEYFPNTSLPALANDNQTAAAVQAAIWFFSDRYVLRMSDPLHAAVVAIVDRIIDEGPLVQPPPPSLTITPSTASGTRRVLGPFTVTTNHPPAIVNATGASMSADRAGRVTIANGDTVESGQTIWLHSTGSSAAVLEATSTATVPSGNVYLYSFSLEGVGDAQRLILAQPATLRTTVDATAEFLPFGKLVVKKTIAGPAAGRQGQVVIRVSCEDDVTRPDFVIPAGSPAGTTSRTYRHIEAGTPCTVTEEANGSTRATTVRVLGNGQEVTIPEGGTETVNIKDIYRFAPGQLIVRKTIAGPAAGKQGEVRIRVKCNGTFLTPDFVIPARTPESTLSMRYKGIRAPATCTVTETVDGRTSTVSVVVEGRRQTVPVPPGKIVTADVSDTYGLTPGELEVNKVIAGPESGHQGEVVIHTVCNGTALTPDFVIPAGTVGPVEPHLYSNIPTPSTCVVTETVDGHTSTVSVDVAGSPTTVKIRPGGSGAATITDTYGSVPGSLLVTKTIAGPRAGHQGPVTIHVVCNGTALSPDFVIDAHTSAGDVSHSFDDIPAGSMCTVTETADGSTDTVIASVSGDGQTVNIPAATVVPVSLMNVYDEGSPALEGTGSLTVIKHITGPAARHHGRIAILVACGGPVFDFAFDIPARTGPGSVTRHFGNIPAGSRCNVTETADGHTNSVAVVASASHTVTIPATGSATVRLTDRFTVKAAPAPRPVVTG